MADQRATLIIKLGDNEIRYEAEREAVEAQLEQIVAPLLRSALHSPVSAEIQAADSLLLVLYGMRKLQDRTWAAPVRRVAHGKISSIGGRTLATRAMSESPRTRTLSRARS